MNNYVSEKKMLYCVVKVVQGTTMPGLSSNSALIQFLHKNNCELDIDLYDLRWVMVSGFRGYNQLYL